MSKFRPVEGSARVADARVAVVAARWNAQITDSLLKAAVATLDRHGLADENIEIYRVPGAFELPLACARLARRGELDGIVALGCVIRGDTPHFDYVCEACTSGLARVALDSGLPIGFGVLTCDNLGQAELRAGDNHDNKGEEATLAVLEMISLLRKIG
ncbi:MAG: 6,7-dimethyl-8-ribityllumazine synthase [Porticoccaceae bacterium]|nr:MAG: 6,7-dimethyl-8-ribityllumazine synthase [Porticoccaceae bacterium]